MKHLDPEKCSKEAESAALSRALEGIAFEVTQGKSQARLSMGHRLEHVFSPEYSEHVTRALEGMGFETEEAPDPITQTPSLVVRWKKATP
jgi:hypothetical protein